MTDNLWTNGNNVYVKIVRVSGVPKSILNMYENNPNSPKHPPMFRAIVVDSGGSKQEILIDASFMRNGDFLRVSVRTDHRSDGSYLATVGEKVHNYTLAEEIKQAKIQMETFQQTLRDSKTH